MANTTNSAAKKPSKNTTKAAQTKAEQPKPEQSNAEPKQAPHKREPKLTDLVTVVSCYYGTLIYENKHTGFTVEWGEFGDSYPMTVEELTAMRNAQRGFFEKQWVLLEGENADAVIEALQLEKYYNNITSIQDIDNIFRCAPKELPGALARFNPSAKETIARRAKELVDEGSLTDINVIRILEESLGFDLLS